MKAVRGFVVTGVLGVNLALFLVSAFATPDVEPDFTEPLLAFLLVASHPNLLLTCDVTLYPQFDIGKFQRYLRPGCTLRLSQNPQTVVVTESVNLNAYRWLPPEEGGHIILHLVLKPAVAKMAVALPDSDKVSRVLTDLRKFPIEAYQRQWFKLNGFTGGVLIFDSHGIGSAAGGGDKDDDPNWFWRIWSRLKNNLLSCVNGEPDIRFPEEPLDTENDLVDPKRAVSPTHSEKTVYWTLEKEGGPPTEPINPAPPRQQKNPINFWPVSPTFSIISGHTGCFCWRRRTHQIVLHHDLLLPGFLPVELSLSPVPATSIETQLNQLVFPDPNDFTDSDSGISEPQSTLDSELPCLENEDLVCLDSLDSGPEITPGIPVTEEGIHAENHPEYIHLDAMPARMISFDGEEEFELGDFLWDD